MPGARSSPEELTFAERVAARCPACGLRVRWARGCPIHGRLAPASAASSVPFTLEAPSVPGYRVGRVLGRGGFGTVFAAERLVDGQQAALKIARSDVLDTGQRLRREIEALSVIGPPHVPAVYDAGTLADGTPYVAMALLEAKTLADRLVESAGPVGVTDFGLLARAILRALAVVHARGYVHRDLKPENVFIDDHSAATLIDFGLVASGSAGTAAAFAEDLTGERVRLGTAEYMAPEQGEGRPDIDARADIYAMGVILYELLSGHPPFWGTPAIVQDGHRNRRPPSLTASGWAAPALEDIVLRCLAKARDDRFASALELDAAIERALAASVPPPSSAPASAAPASILRVAPAPRQERHTVSLVFFESDAGVVHVKKQVVGLGGQLVYSSGKRYVCLYTFESGENPVRTAQQGAKALIEQGVCARARIDLAPVAVQTRDDGSKRFLSLLFSRVDRYPAPGDAAGVLLSPAAATVLANPVEEGSLPSEVASSESLRLEITRGPMSIDGPGGAARTTALLGREGVLDALLASARRAAGERLPSVVTVIGEVGHGKSHLCRVLAERLRATGGQVIHLRASEPTFRGADGTLAELLHRVLDDGAAREPVLSMALGWIAPSAPELRALTAAPGALRSALVVAAAAAVRRRAERGPLFVVIDDAHLADESMLAALEAAASAEEPAPLWVCAVGRPQLEQTRPAWGERAGHHEAHRLGPLDPVSAAQLCRELLWPVDNVPDSAVARLVARAEAVPLLLVELVRGLKREGMVRRDPTNRSYYIATDEIDRLPELPVIEWFAQRRLAALAPPLQRHAELLALLGATVTTAEIEGTLAELDRQGVAADLTLDARVGTRRLIEARILVEDGQGRVGFAQSLVREACARAVPEPLRRQMHLAIFAYYRSADDLDGDRWLPQIAFHAAQAGLGAVAASAYLGLAERASARHAYVDAELHYSRALEQPQDADDPLCAPAYRGRGLMRYRIGRQNDALEDFARARELYVRAGDATAEVDVLLDEAMVLDWMGDFPGAEARVDEARARLSGAGSPLLEARLLLAGGRALYRLNRQQEAAEQLARAASAAERLGDEGYETLVIALLLFGNIHRELNQLADADRALERAIGLCDEHGDRLHLWAAINIRAVLRAAAGDKAGMIVDFARMLSTAQELGHGIMEWMTEMNLGEMLYLMDDEDAAEPHIQHAIAIDGRRRTDRGGPFGLVLGARLHCHRGQEDAAHELLTTIYAHQAQALAEGRTSALMTPATEVLCAMVDLSLRDAPASEWDALEASAATVATEQEQLEVLEMRALTALRRGRAREGHAGLERTLARARGISHMMGARLERELAEAARAAEAATHAGS